MSYKHFTSDERDVLQVMRDKEVDIDIIARILGKSASSIYRELSRNIQDQFYLSHQADMRSRKRRKDGAPRPKRGNLALMMEVEARIKQDHSPEQISGRLKLENPDKPSMQVSYETIYQYIYTQPRPLAEDLRSHLRQGHKKRRKRLTGKDRRGVIPNRTFIDKRPAIVETKSRIGDWEGDTVEGGGKKGYVGTFVERNTKFLIAFPAKRKSADNIVRGARKAFALIPKKYKHTATVDNGKEFAKHEALGKATALKIFFARPYHSWERGLNEHTNGLLRQYLPKKMPLDRLTHRQLAKIVDRINNRPRKILGYLTPREAFFKKRFALRT
jgi:IS30 family transposase